MTCPESCRNRDFIVEFQRFSSGKHRNTANAKKQIFVCKGEKIANAGYLKNIADFVKAKTCTKLSASV